MNYYKRKWDESRGDQYDHWGTITFYYEVDSDDYPTRQIEVYDSGQILKYDKENHTDQYGMLADQPLPAEHFLDFIISKEEFEEKWQG